MATEEAIAMDPFPDYSKTQRIVLLIDLSPLLHLQDPNPYLKTLLSSSKTLLSFPPLSSSLFSFRPFFSSLSPLISSFKLPFPSLSLSFNHPDSTLLSLSDFLTSLPSIINKASFPVNPSRASNLAASLEQLVHDHAWDPLIPDPVAGTSFNFGSSVLIRSNLVILFSPVYGDLNWLREFFDVEMDNDRLSDLGSFVREFFRVFESVNDAFVSRDIHCSWVDVKFESSESEDCEKLGFGFFDGVIRRLGWGFCSTDSIVLGSALVPFGLIYPKIGVSSNCFPGSLVNDDSGRMNVQLSLEILDASTKSLECKCCALEFVSLNLCSRNKQGDVLFTSEFSSNTQVRDNDQNNSSLLEQHFDRVTKVRVRALRRYDEREKFEGPLLISIIVCESRGKLSKGPKENTDKFYADRVLQILARDMGESLVRKPVPIWQIFLSFLYREGYCASVSLSDGNCDLYTGILNPFTVSSAMLCIIDGGFCPNKLEEYGRVGLVSYVAKRSNETRKLCVDPKQTFRFLNSQSHPLASNKFAAKRKKNKNKLEFLHNLTWSAFCQAAAEQLEIDLEEAYFSRDCNNSKKLKFLKCWMKQVQKCISWSSKTPESEKPDQDATEEINHRPIELPQDSEQLASYSASAGEGSSRTLEEAGNDLCSGTSENFFNSLADKIEQGLESGEVELGAFAERLVSSSIYWLYQKHEMKDNSESQTIMVKANDACASKAAVELTKLLLREPKDLAAMHKRRNPSSQASDSRSAGSGSVNIVREYELQILFRMEILQSEVGAMIEEPMKQKFLKQICTLLESIQCHLEGGFFGDWRLDKYVEKVIKSRYYNSLGDVVDRIYTKMDLLLFDDEDELPNNIFNSEDSNQSCKGKLGKDVKYGSNEPVSVEDESPQLQKNDVIVTEDYAQQLVQAQEMREKVLQPSTSILRRVWALKQPKAMKPKSDPLPKLSKRKNHTRATYDMVCETPMTAKKRSSPCANSIDDEDRERSGAQSHGPVSKALFQDDVLEESRLFFSC